MRRNIFIRSIVLALAAVLYAVPAFAVSPVIGSISPSSGSSNSGQEVTFTTTYTDADGWQNLQLGYLLFSASSTSLANCFYAYYNQNTNKLYLRNDANTAWLGGFAPGSANVIENSYAQLNCSSSAVSGSGSTMTVTWKVTFKRAFGGAKNAYLSVKDDTGWSQALTLKGAWTINAANAGPSLGALTPSSGSSNPDAGVTFSSALSDGNGWQDIQYLLLIINTGISGASGLCGYYNQNENKLYLRDDADTAWMGGFAPGSANVIENSYARLDCAGTTVSGSGDTLTVNWKLAFKTAFAGLKNIYLYAADDTGATAGWEIKGTWEILSGNVEPRIDSLSPSSGSSNPGQAVTFISAASDANGWQNVQSILFIVNSNITGSRGFCAYYNQNENKLYLRDDADTAWMGGFAPGSANVIENSYARLDCAGTTVSGSGAALTITWKVSFKAAYAGGKYSYLYAADDAGAVSGWMWMGSWDVLAANAAPQVDSISPAAGSSYPGQRAVFTTIVSDLGGYQDVGSVQFFANEGLFSRNGFAGYYVRAANRLYIMNDDGTAWIGGYAPGAANVIENSYVKLDCAQSAVSGSGNVLSVAWAVTFKAACAGQKSLLVAATDAAGAFSGWYGLGTWTILDGGPKERIYVYMNPAAGGSASGGGSRIAMEENGQKYFFHNDHLGSTSVMTDGTGREAKFIEYKPFGETKTEAGALAVRKKFTGKELDDSTGLYDYAARQYDAKLGRFISPDTELPDLKNPQSLNRYSYVYNNPLKYTDPTGHYVESLSDMASLTMAIQEYQANPSFLSAVAVIGDAAALAVGGVPAVGGYALRATKMLPKLENAGQVRKGLDAAADAGSSVIGGKRVALIQQAEKRLVIGKIEDLQKPRALGQNEYTLINKLPDLKNAKLNWKQNASKLRLEERSGLPIRDASTSSHGELIRDTGFLRAERNLLKNRGRTYDLSTNEWKRPE